MLNHQHGIINSLTGLQIFAAFAILLHHLQGELWFVADTFYGLNQGVGFFYVLSGFILQYSYRSRLGYEGGITPIHFVVLRFFRLWPCHIAVLLLLFLANGNNWIVYILNTFSTGQLFSVVFLLQAWHPDIKVVFALNSPAWSISVEMFFYAMFPLLSRQAFKSPLSPMYFGAALTIAWLIAIWLYMPSSNFETLAGTHPLARIFEFSVGISAYECFTHPKLRFQSGTFVEFGAIVLVFFAVATTHIVANFVGTRFGSHLGWWLGNCAAFWAFSVLIGIFFLQKGRISYIVSSRVLVYLGEISFALYLVHQPVIIYLKNFAGFQYLPLPSQVIVFTIIILGLSSALHHLIEKPCMRVAKRFILRR